MGCDIHLFVEKRFFKYDDEEKENGVWVSADKWSINEYYYLYPDDKESMLHVDRDDCFYTGRNYDLFAILANVRNGHGFIGCDTGDGFIPIFFIPISMPRDLPGDISPEVKAQADDWGADGHSHSWLTLKELLEYDWQQVTKHHGWVDEETYKQFKETGNPYPCCGGVSGLNVVHIGNEELDKIISGEAQREEGKSYYTKIEWEKTYADCCKTFTNKTLPKLKKLARDENDYENIRIVFWFDN